jgi:hypothetical protein
MDENNSLLTAVEAVLGEYTPIERTYDITRSEVVVIGDVPETVEVTDTITEYGLNWAWFAGLLVFCIFIHGFLRAVGGMLKCRI